MRMHYAETIRKEFRPLAGGFSFGQSPSFTRKLFSSNQSTDTSQIPIKNLSYEIFSIFQSVIGLGDGILHTTQNSHL